MDFKTFQNLEKLFSKHGFKLFLVGGSVRDYLLYHHFEDMDVATNAPLEKMKEFLFFKKMFPKMESGTILFDNELIDVTRLRKEEEYLDFRHPDTITPTEDINLDAQRRDFTCNAIYLDANGKIIDPTNGLSDLKEKKLRIIGDSSKRIKEDPLRILRAIRFAYTLDFKMDEELLKAIKTHKTLLKKLQYSKIVEELNKFKLAPENVRNILKKYEIDEVLPLNYEQHEKIIFDLHCDTITRLYETKESLVKNNGAIDLNKMQKGGYLGQVFAVFINLKKHDNPYQYALDVIDYYHKVIKENDFFIEEALSYNDFMKIKSKGKMIAMLSIEEGGILEGDISRIDELYSKGVRMMSLTWNYKNSIGAPNVDALTKPIDLFKINNQDGLTEFGKKVIKRMNEIGMIIDISHLSDKGVEEVLKLSTKPVVASHSSYRDLYPVSRNLPPHLINDLKGQNGVMGLNYCLDFITNDENHYLLELKNQWKTLIDTFGVNVLSFGSDFDGFTSVDALKDASDMNKILDYLKEILHSKKDLEKIGYLNFLKVLKAHQNS